MERQRLLFVPMLALLAFNVLAQGPIMLRQTMGAGAAYGYIQWGGAKAYVQQSVGQGSVIGAFRTGGKVLRQGFLQPHQLRTRVASNASLQVTVFPNPYQDRFSLRFAELLEDPLRIRMMDLGGRVVYEARQVAAEEIVVVPVELASGHYVLHLLSGGRSAAIHLQHQTP